MHYYNRNLNSNTINNDNNEYNEQNQITNGGVADGSVDIAALSDRLETFNRVVRQAQAQKSQTVQAESKSDKGDSSDANTIATAISKEDTSSSPSEVAESKAPAIDELTLEDENDDENRNKR